MRAPRPSRLVSPAAALLVVPALLSGCGSAPSSANAAAPTLDPATPIDFLDVDACALLTPERADAVTGVPMTAPAPAAVIPGTSPDRSSCEYLPSAEPTTSATTIQFFVQHQDDVPFGTYDAGLEIVRPNCEETSEPPSAATACAYQRIEVAGALPAFVLYPGPGEDGSESETPTDAGLQLYWFAGGLAFSIITTASGVQATDSLRAAADQIARELA